MCQVYFTIVWMLGKGMHDGAGAWLKSAAARAVLGGVGIGSVEEFFQFCVDKLQTNSSHSRNFTSQRYFYLVDVTTAALYRATMSSKVTGSLKIKCTSKSSDRTGVNYKM